MKVPFFLTFTIAALATCHAQLGESEEKCTALFGKPFRVVVANGSSMKNAQYRTRDFQITAAVKDGTAAYLTYRKSDGSSMTDAEIESILKAHSTEQRRWSKKMITGERRRAVGALKTPKGPFQEQQRGPREWEVPNHEEFGAAYYFERNVLAIWNSKSGFDGEAILRQR